MYDIVFVAREFLSTLSLRRATSNESSEHTDNSNFYPRSPCGERLVDTVEFAGSMLFLSTLSLRRATENGFAGVLFLIDISIHALLAESDEVMTLDRWLAGLFLSTLSLRRATRCN